MYEIAGFVQERRNSIANAPELRLSCTNPWRSSSTTNITAHILYIAILFIPIVLFLLFIVGQLLM